MNTRLSKFNVRFAVYSLLSANPGDFFTTAEIRQVLKLHCAQGEIRRALGFYMRGHKIVRHGTWDRGGRIRRYAALTEAERRASQAKKRRGRRVTR